MLRKLLGVVFVLAGIPALAHPVTLPQPTDLRIDARLIQRKNTPLIVLFSLPGCPYCKVVRENYLAPLIRDASPANRPLILEVDITSNAPLKGFEGEALTQSSFAARYHVKATPTVIMLSQTGKPLTSPLVGGDSVGFYGGYLDNALAAAKKSLSEQAGMVK